MLRSVLLGIGVAVAIVLGCNEVFGRAGALFAIAVILGAAMLNELGRAERYEKARWPR